jgi:hypothetical protein
MITTVIISSISVKPLEELFGRTGKRIRGFASAKRMPAVEVNKSACLGSSLQERGDEICHLAWVG